MRLAGWSRPLAYAIGLGSLVPIAAVAAVRDLRITGEWRIESKKATGPVEFGLRRERRSAGSTSSWSSTFDLERAAIEGITSAQWSASEAPVRFRMRRDAGTLRGEGKLRHGDGSGTFAFESDPAYVAALSHSGFAAPDAEELARLWVHDVSLDLVRSAQARGLDPSLDDLMRLRVHDISAGFVDAMMGAGISDPTVDDLVRLKVHGIAPDYVRAMSAVAGPGLSTEDVVRLRINGVDPSLPRELRSLGYARASAEELVRLRISGVTPEWLRRATEQRGKQSIEELIQLKLSGGP